MRVSLTLSALVLLLSPAWQSVQGYGMLGHTLTGQVAQRLLTRETARQVEEILPAYYDGLLSKAAPWPDTIKRRPQYRWTSVFHYVNTPGDNPPDHCRFAYSRDRHDVINGIFNMTATLLHYQAHPPAPRSKWRHVGVAAAEKDDDDDDQDAVHRSVREDALRFLVHFMGDLHQPLHTAGKARGGNEAQARWRRAKTNLHKIWDGQLILKDIQDNFDKDPKAYLDNILEMTRSEWTPASFNWTQCDEATMTDELADNPWAADLDAQPSSLFGDQQQQQEHPIILHHLCPKAWAREMNALACEFCWHGYLGPEGDHSQGEYYDRATGPDHGFLVRRLIAQSGLRMAAVLNAIYDPTHPVSLGLVPPAAVAASPVRQAQWRKSEQEVDRLIREWLVHQYQQQEEDQAWWLEPEPVNDQSPHQQQQQHQQQHQQQQQRPFGV